MLTNFFILMKQELIVTVLIFILLIIKIGKDRTNESIINLVNGLLLISLIAGLCSLGLPGLSGFVAEM
ncbi:MAG: NADH-quinone oxidoreductase subunit M, partial [Flavisolibacter sp.]|nr:NADH-quinone oxidoreductase subunit M [Flavisolibacter sp.]